VASVPKLQTSACLSKPNGLFQGHKKTSIQRYILPSVLVLLSSAYLTFASPFFEINLVEDSFTVMQA
jgi:hypothetical protein